MIVVDRETFFDQLGLRNVKARIRDRKEGDRVCATIIEFLRAEGVIELEESSEDQLRELNLMIPGTSLHVALTSELKVKLKDLALIALILLGIGQGAWPAVAAGLLTNLIAKISTVRKQYGERCILESLGEINQRSREAICVNLYGHPCRYPRAGCQFMKPEGETCGFGLDGIQQTLHSLEAREIIRRENSVEPFIWKIVF
jgi:hypothetical protein